MSAATTTAEPAVNEYDEAAWAAAAAERQTHLSQCLRYAAHSMGLHLTDPDAVMSNKRRNQLMTDQRQTLFVSTLVLDSPTYIPMAEAWLAAAERTMA